MSKRLSAALVVAMLLYGGGYVMFRQFHNETWPQDRQRYVIFPEGRGAVLYYAWRPLSYLDGALTVMRARIGPHR
ncbi:MAG: hypothetical protein IT537_19505 [Hyphomicrobiales bacterium]|nr:hypothetical protein [Hyphomicrobiales bacterium]